MSPTPPPSTPLPLPEPPAARPPLQPDPPTDSTTGGRQGGQGRIDDITSRQGTSNCSCLEHCFLFQLQRDVLGAPASLVSRCISADDIRLGALSLTRMRGRIQGRPLTSEKLATAAWRHKQPILMGVFTLDDARPFFALTSKIPPLSSMSNFDANVKERTPCHPL